MEYAISTILIVLSALFSGLTLGLLSLDTYTLKRQTELGNTDAARIYPIRKRGNLLLTTLLLGNVAVNTALSVFLGSITSGVAAGIIATSLIFVFGEILPQAVISRHALWFGSHMTWFVRIATVVLYPVAAPIAFALDRLLGEEIPQIYSKHELMKIISEHEDSELSTIDQDEERIVHGALTFSHTQVAEVMTPLAKVILFRDTTVINHDLRTQVTEEGYSRYPIYRNTPTHIVGLLYAKDLLIEADGTRIQDATQAFEKDFLTTAPEQLLDDVMKKMLLKKKHLAVVVNKHGACVGVVTLEDVLEEIIQFEIEDEDDG